MADVLEEMGPVGYLCVEFPPGSTPGTGLPLLVDLVDRRIIRILDMRFLRKEPDGSITALEGEQVDGGGLALFQGASSGLLDDEDLMEGARALEPGCAAAIVIYENRWAAPLAVQLRKNGAQLVAHGQIPVQAILASLEALEEQPAMGRG
jgi:uncharacterized protein DUF6325